MARYHVKSKSIYINPAFLHINALFPTVRYPFFGSTTTCGSSSSLNLNEAMVLFKVGVSCYAAVLSDAKLKGFSSSSARTGQPGQRFAAGFFSSQMVVLMGAHWIL